MSDIVISETMLKIMEELARNSTAIITLAEKVNGYILLTQERESNRKENCEAHMKETEINDTRLRVLEDWKSAENGIFNFILKIVPLLASAIAIILALRK